jgi:hypothetical protein
MSEIFSEAAEMAGSTLTLRSRKMSSTSPSSVSEMQYDDDEADTARTPISSTGDADEEWFCDVRSVENGQFAETKCRCSWLSTLSSMGLGLTSRIATLLKAAKHIEELEGVSWMNEQRAQRASGVKNEWYMYDILVITPPFLYDPRKFWNSAYHIKDHQTLFLLLPLLFRSTSNFSATSLVLLHLSNLLEIVENPYWMYENEKMTKKASVQGAATFQK